MNTPNDPSSVDIKLLRALIILMQEASVSRAAVKLNISQPTMSHTLARLRRIFDDPLLVLTRGKMTPTTRGGEIRTEVEALLASFDRLVSPREPFDANRSQMRVSVMAPEFVADLIAPRMAFHMQSRAPHMSIEFLNADPARSLEFLEQGIADFRLGWWPEPAPALRRKILWTEKLVCITRPRRSRAAKQLEAEEYLNCEHVRVRTPGRSFSMALIDAAAARAGHNLKIAAWVQNASTLVNVVAATDLVGTMSQRLAVSFSHVPLEIFSVPLQVPDLKVAIYWHERTHRSPAHQWVRNLINEIASAR